jgi:hypothetical protein
MLRCRATQLDSVQLQRRAGLKRYSGNIERHCSVNTGSSHGTRILLYTAESEHRVGQTECTDLITAYGVMTTAPGLDPESEK